MSAVASQELFFTMIAVAMGLSMVTTAILLAMLVRDWIRGTLW
jgi:hypothetical protein